MHVALIYQIANPDATDRWNADTDNKLIAIVDIPANVQATEVLENWAKHHGTTTEQFTVECWAVTDYERITV